MTVHCSKPLFFIDEFLMLWAISFNVLGLSDEEVDCRDFYCEHEWIMPADMRWKLVDREKLIFRV